MTYSYLDHRLFQRHYPTTLFPQAIRIYPYDSNQVIEGSWNDLSAGGVKIHLKDYSQFKKSTPVKVRFALPGKKLKAEFDAKITWQNETEVGLQFINLKSIEISELENAVHELQQSKNNITTKLSIAAVCSLIIFSLIMHKKIGAFFNLSPATATETIGSDTHKSDPISTQQKISTKSIPTTSNQRIMPAPKKKYSIRNHKTKLKNHVTLYKDAKKEGNVRTVGVIQQIRQ